MSDHSMKDDIQRIGVTARYSDAVIHAGTVYAVEVPAHEDGDIASQTSSLLELLEATLLRAGSSKARILMATVYLIDMDDYAGMNAIWDAWLPPGCAPTRACVKVAGLARPGWRVEIAVTAAI